MIEIRPFASLGKADYGWLQANYHFSFANYYDPKRTGWGKLKVWNDDTVMQNKGFPLHSHRDMEIITFVRSGAVTHEDSQGNKGKTYAGQVQVMSAGTGISHSEYNWEDTPTLLFQIWIESDIKSIPAYWASKTFPTANPDGKFDILASGFAEDKDALKINTDSRVLRATINQEQIVKYELSTGRLAYLVSAKGKISVNGYILNPRDGMAIKDETKLEISAFEDSEIVLVDTAKL